MFDYAAADAAFKDIAQTLDGRKLRTLEKIHAVCRDYAESGGREFTVSNIGRIGKGRGVPTYASLRNPAAEPYRILIQSWARLSEPVTKRKRVRGDYEWTERITEPDIKFLVNSLIAENKALKKTMKEVVSPLDGQLTINMSMKTTQTLELTEPEWEALRLCIDKKRLEKHGLHPDERGRLLNEKGDAVMTVGFCSAIEKIITLEAG